MKVAWNPKYCHRLPSNHRFPMEKYELLPQQLLHEGTISQDDLFDPGQLLEKDITNVHQPMYWQKVRDLCLSPSEVRRTGFPLSQALVDRETSIAQGTLEASYFALEQGVAFNIAGGTHHAGSDFGEGFCLLNDIAIASQRLLLERLVSRILIIDLDVHQGNGTAEIFSANPQVVTFSMHGAKNFPMKKQKSSLDINLEDGLTDDVYLNLLEHHLLNFCDQISADFVYYQAGVDVLDTDALGRLSLTLNGCRNRDRLVLEFCKNRGIPLVVVMGGGYSPQLNTIVEAHANTYRLAQQLYF